jgi:hypothetical protein
VLLAQSVRLVPQAQGPQVYQGWLVVWVQPEYLA